MQGEQHGSYWSLIAAICVVQALACGSHSTPPQTPAYRALISPGIRAPSTPLEHAILQKLPQLPPGDAVTVHGHAVIAYAQYSAASQRPCRKIEIRNNSSAENQQNRLVCQVNNQWHFVPSTLRSPRHGEKP